MVRLLVAFSVFRLIHMAIVEPVFANIRIQKRLDHIPSRTKSKVDVQWKLFTLVHNIGKIHTYGLPH